MAAAYRLERKKSARWNEARVPRPRPGKCDRCVFPSRPTWAKPSNCTRAIRRGFPRCKKGQGPRHIDGQGSSFRSVAGVLVRRDCVWAPPTVPRSNHYKSSPVDRTGAPFFWNGQTCGRAPAFRLAERPGAIHGSGRFPPRRASKITTRHGEPCRAPNRRCGFRDRLDAPCWLISVAGGDGWPPRPGDRAPAG